MPNTHAKDELEKKRAVYTKELKWLASALSKLSDKQRKLESKRTKYEEKLQEIDGPLQSL